MVLKQVLYSFLLREHGVLQFLVDGIVPEPDSEESFLESEPFDNTFLSAVFRNNYAVRR